MNAHRKHGQRVEHHKIGIFPQLDPAFPVAQARMPRRPRAQPFHDSAHAPTPLPCLCPQQAQPQAQPTYPAPRVHDIARVEALQARDTWRMIGHNKVDRAVVQCLPQAGLVFGRADWGTALEFGAAGGDRRRGEAEVVEAGFYGQREAGGFGISDERQCGGRGQVHDVCAEGGVRLLEGNDGLDGGDFKGVRTGVEEGAI